MITINYKYMYVIGTAREIRSLYRNLERKTELWPYYSDFPKFDSRKMYGIAINTDYASETYGSYSVVGETDICLLLTEEVERRTYVHR